MPDIVTPNEGELKLLAKGVLGADENLLLKLFKNDYTPAAGTTAANFTEADFTGYAAKTLTPGSFSAPATVGGKAQTTYAAQTFASSGGSDQQVHGYWVEGATSGKVYWAQRIADSPTYFLMIAGTGELTITPTYEFESLV